MKEGKAARAIEHLDDGLIAAAMNGSDFGTEPSKAEFERRKSMKRKALWTKWVAIAAVFAVVFTSGLFAVLTVGASESVVALDVNPSIELNINKKEKITKVNAINDEAVTVIGDMDLKGVDLNIALNAIIGSMVTNGYLSTDQNSILISIDSKNEKRAELLREKLSGEIGELLKNSNIEASVITQVFNKDGKQSGNGKISEAKATLISKIVAAGLLDAGGVPYTYEVLAELKVNELKLILESKGISIDGVSSSGTASSGKYISREAAVAAALERAGIVESDISKLEVEFDYDDDYRALVYEVEFRYGEKKYEYELNATTGDILDEKIKTAKKDDDDEDDKNVSLPDGVIDRNEALEKAYADAGVSAADVKRPEIEVDREGGKYVYEIEFETKNKEYEYVIDAVSGDILQRESEPRD